MLVISIILLPKYITENKSMMLMLEFEAILLYSYFTGSLIIITIEVRLRTSFILYIMLLYVIGRLTDIAFGRRPSSLRIFSTWVLIFRRIDQRHRWLSV